MWDDLKEELYRIYWFHVRVAAMRGYTFEFQDWIKTPEARDYIVRYI